MVTAIIVDDEIKSAELLTLKLGKFCPQVNVTIAFTAAEKALVWLQDNKPDVVFLDIEMPGMNGLGLAAKIAGLTEIVFVTAYEKYSIDAIRLTAFDYLLKPIQHTQLMEAVQRFFKRKDQQKTAQLKNLRENLSGTASWEEKRIAVPSGQTIHFFKPAEIIMIKGEAAYSEIHLANGSKMLASRNLRHFEEMLEPIPAFFRSHKSYIVNRSAVLQYVKSDGGYLTLTNGMQAGISTDKISEFLKDMS